MTREEAIQTLKWFREYEQLKEEDYRIQDKNGNWYYLITEQDFEAFELAIKALEQEPFINKPCVSSEVCEHDKNEVLDKIREQIKSDLRGVEIALEVLVENDPLRPKMEGAKDTLENCLEIIDKAESEKREDGNDKKTKSSD